MIESFAWIVDHDGFLTLLTAAIGGFVALAHYRSDKAWQKKQFAFDFVERMFDDDRTMAALRMLDWDNGEFTAKIMSDFKLDKTAGHWSAAEVAQALRDHDSRHPGAGEFTRKEYAIRELFDACLNHFDRLGHFLRTGIIAADDVPGAITYYPLLGREARGKERNAALLAYMRRYRYTDAGHFFAEVEKHNPEPAAGGER